MMLAEAGIAMKKRLREWHWYYAARTVYDNTTVEADDAWKPEVVDRATATAPHQLRSNLGKRVEALPRPRTTKIVRALFQQIGAPHASTFCVELFSENGHICLCFAHISFVSTMVRRRASKSGPKAKGKPRPIDRKDSKINRWNTADDIPLDEEDQCQS